MEKKIDAEKIGILKEKGTGFIAEFKEFVSSANEQALHQLLKR